jgi:hypothetical protein
MAGIRRDTRTPLAICCRWQKLTVHSLIVLPPKEVDAGLRALHVLLRCAGTETDTANYLAVDRNWQASTDDTQSATKCRINAECQAPSISCSASDSESLLIDKVTTCLPY